tara:strand:+ start:2971 stop:3957 length:987 start_codon:yes stop_codon:yes gene_type:complete
MFHFVFQLLTIVNVSLYLKFNIQIPLVVVACGRIFSLIFFYLFLKSIYENKRAKLKFIYLIPCLIVILANYLNVSGNKLFSFIDDQIVIENLLGFYSYDFIGKDDVYWVCVINAVFFKILIFRKFFQILTNHITPEKNKKYITDIAKFYYIPITITSFSTLMLLGLFLINIESTVFIIITKLIGIFTVMNLIIKPVILANIARIKDPYFKDQNLENVYTQILLLFKEESRYLDPSYSSVKISADTGVRNELIRNSIKMYSEMSVPTFINSHRVNYAVKLINEGYLENYSIEGLAENSGFSSQENFNRVFKLIKSCTPSEYLKTKSEKN